MQTCWARPDGLASVVALLLLLVSRRALGANDERAFFWGEAAVQIAAAVGAHSRASGDAEHRQAAANARALGFGAVDSVALEDGAPVIRRTTAHPSCGRRPCFLLDSSMLGAGVTPRPWKRAEQPTEVRRWPNAIVTLADKNNKHLPTWSAVSALVHSKDYVLVCAAGPKHVGATVPATERCGAVGAAGWPGSNECGCGQHYHKTRPSLRLVLTATGLLKLLRPEFGGADVQNVFRISIVEHGSRFLAKRAELRQFEVDAADVTGAMVGKPAAAKRLVAAVSDSVRTMFVPDRTSRAQHRDSIVATELPPPSDGDVFTTCSGLCWNGEPIDTKTQWEATDSGSTHSRLLRSKYH
eukprot:SAG31_NODE_7433_length_1689_cov_3.311950_1_plen_354_part_00